MSILPVAVESELFNMEYKAGDGAVEFICDILHEYEYIVHNIDNYDHAIKITFKNDKSFGSIRVDRIFKNFNVCIRTPDNTIMPFIGDWNGVIEYIKNASI